MSIDQEKIQLFLNAAISMDHLIATACEGTNVNIGKSSGVVRMPKMGLSRHRVLWQLHMNELPFRYLFEHVDANLSGPLPLPRTVGK